MQNKQLDPTEWESTLQSCRDKWARMTADERNPYVMAAVQEQGLRDEACHQPFAPHKQGNRDPLFPAAFDAAKELGRNALKKVSKHRAFESYRQFKSSTDWQYLDAGLGTADGAISLDAIDITSTDCSIADVWGKFTQSMPVDVDDLCENAGAHHTTCWTQQGFCKRSQHLGPLVSRLVASFSKHLESRSLSLAPVLAHPVELTLLHVGLTNWDLMWFLGFPFVKHTFPAVPSCSNFDLRFAISWNADRTGLWQNSGQILLRFPFHEEAAGSCIDQGFCTAMPHARIQPLCVCEHCLPEHPTAESHD